MEHETAALDVAMNSFTMSVFFVASSTDSVQVSHGFLPVQHPGQLLLAAGGGHVSADAACLDFCLSEEILLVVHPDWMG